jgi:hypothetical protein
MRRELKLNDTQMEKLSNAYASSLVSFTHETHCQHQGKSKKTCGLPLTDGKCSRHKEDIYAPVVAPKCQFPTTTGPCARSKLSGKSYCAFHDGKTPNCDKTNKCHFVYKAGPRKGDTCTTYFSDYIEPGSVSDEDVDEETAKINNEYKTKYCPTHYRMMAFNYGKSLSKEAQEEEKPLSSMKKSKKKSIVVEEKEEKKVNDSDNEEEEKPKKSKKVSKKVISDDEEEKPKKSKKVNSDDEEEKPKKSKKSKKVNSDDEEEEKPKKKSKKSKKVSSDDEEEPSQALSSSQASSSSQVEEDVSQDDFDFEDEIPEPKGSKYHQLSYEFPKDNKDTALGGLKLIIGDDNTTYLRVKTRANAEAEWVTAPFICLTSVARAQRIYEIIGYTTDEVNPTKIRLQDFHTQYHPKMEAFADRFPKTVRISSSIKA